LLKVYYFPYIATIIADSVLTSLSSGSVLITARKDGAVGLKRITIMSGGNADADGLPDEFELANGLNPNDPIEAQENDRY